MIGGSNALTAFDQRPHFATTIDNGFQTLEHKYDPYVMQKGARKRTPLYFALIQMFSFVAQNRRVSSQNHIAVDNGRTSWIRHIASKPKRDWRRLFSLASLHRQLMYG